MGWASGSEIAVALIEPIKANVPDAKARRAIYSKLIEAMEAQDWDTQDEATGIDAEFDAVLSARGRS